MKINSYKDLIVWQRGMELVAAAYRLTDSYPKEELYSLTSQIRRAAVSIPANIAEGRKRSTRKDFCHFLTIAYGSASELETHLEISRRLPFGARLDYTQVDKLLGEVIRMLNTMISKLKS